ncbi:hypothetical protein O181_071982 [Austropuccinia psidii MF-1]|uniref:Integrase catalytic domain-containing protein n=1 Tax=Austropuccinia psidii MF-1 TaxID=1389203 RepID=A0A9Q3F681_9BASI|nr:hypothetical protein [Austropuccinia psidii MF-1]
MSGESVARPEIVMNKLLDLINHQKSKNMSFPSKQSNSSKIAELLSNASSYPYKIMYVCQNGKYNPKNTTHKEINFWVEHPELHPPSNQNKKKYNKQEHEAETHQTGMSALLKRRFKKVSNENGFAHVTSPPNTPQLNGFAEQANRTILEKAWYLLLGTNLPNQYWMEAVNHATLLTNLVPTPSRDNLSPFQLWTGNSPKIKCLRMFGSYCVLKLNDKKVFITRHIIFFENYFLSLKNTPKSDEETLFYSDNIVHIDNEEKFFYCKEQLEDEDSNRHNPPEEEAIQSSANLSMEESNEEIIAAHPKKRIKVIGPRHPTLISPRIIEENILPYCRQHKALMTLSNTSNPASFKQAIKSDNAKHWLQAMSKDLGTMNELKVCNMVPITNETKLVGTTCVFKTNCNERNEILEHKSQLCSQGFCQPLTQNQGTSMTAKYHKPMVEPRYHQNMELSQTAQKVSKERGDSPLILNIQVPPS